MSSIREDIEAAMAGADKKEAPEEIESAEVEEVEGNFEGADFSESDEEAEGIDEPLEDGDAKEEVKAEPELSAIDAPKSWSKDDLKSWQSLPREVQEVVSRREKERDEGTLHKLQEIQRFKQKYQSLEGAIAPYQEWLHLSKTDLPTAINNYFATQQWMMRDPKAALTHLASQLNVNLQELATQTPEQNKPDPRVQQLESQIARLQHAQQQQQNVVQQRMHEQALGEVQSFMNSTDETGNLKYPHFSELEQDIEALVPILRQMKPAAGTKEILQEAYDKAAWGNATVREQMKQEEFRKLQEAKRAEALKAKGRAKSVSGSPNGTITNAPDTSIRGLLEAQLYGTGHV